MQHLIRFIPAIALALISAGAAHAQGVRILGRSEPERGGGFILQWPGSGFEAKFTGKRLTATIDDYGDNWLNVEIDGVASKLDLQEGPTNYTLFNGTAGEHTIRITRRTGAPSGPTRVLDIRSDGPIAPTAMPERRMLVIGDSITSGYGVEGADQFCTYTHATQNADLAYPALAAKDFGADLHSISIDGYGLIRNYAGDDATMDKASWKMLPGGTSLWPGSVYQPQVIVINLGTSDFSAGDPGDRFDAAYIGMLRKLRAAYAEAKIFAVFGPMLSGDAYVAARASVFGATETIRKDGDLRVSFIEFSPPQSARRFGCDWHPGLDAHRAMATRLEAAVQKELGWAMEATELDGRPVPEGNPVVVWTGQATAQSNGDPSPFSLSGSLQ